MVVQPQEVMEARYFGRDELPGEMLLGHHQQALEAIDGVRGAVWTHKSEWDFPPGLTRQELYRLRDASGMAPAEFYQQYVGKLLPNGHCLEVAGKVDVY